MARESVTYRLWDHESQPSAKAARTVIAKVRPAQPDRTPLGALTGSARMARAAGVAANSGLTRLLDNARISSIEPIVVVGAPSGGRPVSMLDGAAGDYFGHGAGRHPSGSAPGQVVEIRVSRGTTPGQLAAQVARLHDVEYAFVPPPRYAFGRRSHRRADPLATRLWGHGAIRLGQARARARFNNAAAITVAVVDSGIDRRHPDLEDIVIEYKNFIGGSNKDWVGHGTHVAGIIAATAGNGLGISGVCGANILALKALPRRGETFDSAAYYRALRYVIGKADVLNLSLGGPKDLAEIDVLRDVIASGVVVVAAMGNDYENGDPVEYPAAIPAVCAVGATDERDKRASFSNTGRHIDLVAPGVNILSTTPRFNYDGDGAIEYDAWDGTSMATPHVAAAAALVLAKWPGTSPAKVIDILTSSADRVAGAKKGSAAYGAGRLNCERALR